MKKYKILIIPYDKRVFIVLFYQYVYVTVDYGLFGLSKMVGNDVISVLLWSSAKNPAAFL